MRTKYSTQVYRSLFLLVGALSAFAPAGCDPGATDLDIESVDGSADEVEAAPVLELSEEDGLHRFAPEDAPLSASLRDEDAPLSLTLTDSPAVAADAPAWCKVNESCSWCGDSCGAGWPFGGTYVYYGNRIWQNNACYCKAAYAACEWVSGCAS